MRPIQKWPEEMLKLDDGIAEGGAHGRIQWKGTSVCIDVHCVCGHHGHVDDEFMYFYECPQCHTCFAVGQTVRLYELTGQALERAKAGILLKTPEYYELPDGELVESGCCQPNSGIGEIIPITQPVPNFKK